MSAQEQINVNKNELDTFFIRHLNKVYTAKSLLIEELPEILENAHFADLRAAIEETINGVRQQMVRMDEIYQILNVEISDVDTGALKGMIEDSFNDIKFHGGNAELRDMSILFYLQIIESMEMASFQILQMLAVKLKNDRIKLLIKNNYDDARKDRTLLLLITAKYISTV